jgi:hypothetical protein
MKKLLLLSFLLISGCAFKHQFDYNNYQPEIFNNIEIDNLLNKKWLLEYYIIEEKVFPIEGERQNDFYIFKSNNQKEEIFYGKSINGSWEFLPHGNFIMFYSDDMNTYVPVRIVELTRNTFKFVFFDIKSMKFVTVAYESNQPL